MSPRKRLFTRGCLSAFLLFTIQIHSSQADERKFVKIQAKDKYERTEIVNSGVSIEFIRSDSVWGIADPDSLEALQSTDLKIIETLDFNGIDHGNHATQQKKQGDFPAGDERYHDYEELKTELMKLQAENPELARVHDLGKTIEDRQIPGIHINSDPEALETEMSGKPGIVFTGAHHAREHLSTEIPLMLAQHLLKNKDVEPIKTLLETRDIWIFPMINPDGVEYDIKGGKYKLWRKNRRDNGRGIYGVDLNRNYGFKWATGGASSNPRSDIFHGPSPFSEPETEAVKRFVDDQANLKMVISFHTFSELILYPWGHTYDPIENQKDLKTHKMIAEKMAEWNGYTPQQSSDLYIASGDTTDWTYGEHGLISFTFELSPKSGFFGGGFYPGPEAIDTTFAANIKPCLYLIELTDDPHKVLEDEPLVGLEHYVAPKPSLTVGVF